MAIRFEFFENPSPDGEKSKKGYHARVLKSRTIETATLIRDIEERSSLTESDVQAALSSLSRLVCHYLQQGDRVHLDGFGYFQVTLKCKKVDKRRKMTARNVSFKAIKFIPEVDFRKEVANLKIERAGNPNRSLKLSEIEIDRRLTEYFRENTVLTRVDFQAICKMTRQTASRHIKRLREEKKLKNISHQNQPIYVPVPGNYGVSRDAIHKKE